MERVDVLVIGAGVVGLAVARRLARAGREVVVAEAAEAIGTGTSSRNSEVIHAGIYYPKGSLKARLCVAGREALYDYCADRGVAHRRTGKLIVAAEAAEVPRLEAVRAAAAGNGVALERLDGAAARALEPELVCAGALLSPLTGVVDSHALMLSLQGEAEDHGAVVALHAPLTGGGSGAGGLEAQIGGDAPLRLSCRGIVNAAGLGAWDAARALGTPEAAVPPRFLAKGNYYAPEPRRAPFGRLIYPLPEEGGLGVHLTLDLAGTARFGPDVEWLGQGEAGSGGVAGAGRRLPGLDPALVAGDRRPRAGSGLLRDPAEAVGAGRAGGRFPRRRAGNSRGGGPGQSVRHRISGSDGVSGARRSGGGAAGDLTFPMGPGSEG